MAKTMRRAVWSVLGLSFWLAACGVPEGDETGAVRSALNDTDFVTQVNSRTALATTSAFVMSVWTGNAPNSQIVGQAFGPTGSPLGFEPASRVYSTSDKPATAPSVVRNPADTAYLLVWQEDYSPTDSDIKAQQLTDDGRTIGSNVIIENDGSTEKTPVVTALPGQPSPWLVTYTRAEGSTTTLVGRFVDGGGTPSAPITIVASGISSSAVKHTVSYLPSAQRIMITWNDFKVSFAPVSTLLPDATSSLPAGIGVVGAVNTVNGRFGIAWREGSGTSSKVGARTFGTGCSLLSCATAAVFPVQAGGTVTALNLPVIAPLGTGFGIGVGLLPTSLKTIKLATVTATGAVGSSVSTVAATCPGSISGGSLGQQDSIAAATPKDSSTDREFVIYDTFCPQLHRIRVAGVTPALAVSSFDVAD